jgi:hypothetical protein
MRLHSKQRLGAAMVESRTTFSSVTSRRTGEVVLGVLMMTLSSGCEKGASPVEKLAPEIPIRVEARVDRAVASVGDKIVFTVQAIVNEGVEVTLPYDLHPLEGLEVKGVQSLERKQIAPKQFLYRRQWVLSPGRVGAYILEPLEVSYVQRNEIKAVKTPGIYIDVRSVLQEGDLEGDIKDIKGPVGLTSFAWIIVAIAAGVILVGLFSYYGAKAWRYRRRTIPIVPPHEWALAEIQRLLSSGLLKPDTYKAFAARSSDILRTYVEKRFAIMAPERTTEEFIGEIGGRTDILPEQHDLLKKFLGFCDMVKFARYGAVESEMTEGVDTVRRFVEQTKPVPIAEGSKGERRAQGD